LAVLPPPPVLPRPAQVAPAANASAAHIPALNTARLLGRQRLAARTLPMLHCTALPLLRLLRCLLLALAWRPPSVPLGAGAWGWRRARQLPKHLAWLPLAWTLLLLLLTRLGLCLRRDGLLGLLRLRAALLGALRTLPQQHSGQRLRQRQRLLEAQGAVARMTHTAALS
jgi:hypothetical protein